MWKTFYTYMARIDLSYDQFEDIIIGSWINEKLMSLYIDRSKDKGNFGISKINKIQRCS